LVQREQSALFMASVSSPARGVAKPKKWKLHCEPREQQSGA